MKTQNILIPTDFSLASLNAITGLIQQKPNQKFNITLVHFLQLSDSISELLMLSRRSHEYKHISQEFQDQVNTFRQQYQAIETLHTEFFYGSTVAVFKNYLEAKEIDLIVALQKHEYAKITQNSIDPTLLLQRSGCELIKVKPAIITQPAPVTATRITRSKLEYQML